MKSKKNTPPGGDPGGAKACVQNKRRWPIGNRESASAQGAISFRDGRKLAAKIIVADGRALLFVADHDGLRQVGGVLDVGGGE